MRSPGASSSVAPCQSDVDELGALDRAALAQHEVLQQLELLEGEGGRLAVDQHALARDVDDDAAGGAVLVLGLVLLRAGDRGRLVQCEAHDVHVAAAGADRGEGDGGVRLGVGRELGERAAQRVDEDAEVDAGCRGLGLVDADVQGEAAGRGAGGKAARPGRRRARRGGRVARPERSTGRNGAQVTGAVAGRSRRAVFDMMMVLAEGTRAVVGPERVRVCCCAASVMGLGCEASGCA